MTVDNIAASSAKLEDAPVPTGRIVSVTGSQAILLLEQATAGASAPRGNRPEIGTLFKVDTPLTSVLCLVSALSVPAPVQHKGEGEIWIAELELVGELTKDENGRSVKFRRGVSMYPALGDVVYPTTRRELELAYSWSSEAAIKIGTIRQDSNIPAMVRIDDLLSKHFAIVGNTGTGKSCSTALVLRSILDAQPNAHIVLLDPHNEYAGCFEDRAEVITPKDLTLPYWFLTFEEIVEVLVCDEEGRDKQIEILNALIPLAKARYSAPQRPGTTAALRKDRTREIAGFTVDSPVPYRMSDITEMIRERMGRLELKNHLGPYKRLKSRIEAVSNDPRYGFMFGRLSVQDHMSDILGRMLRIPVNGKPISILELTGLPSEIVNVVVSVLCRMTFDFAHWSNGMVPVTLVCEEAHRYIPADKTRGFEPTRRSIAKIAKEGRKYGVSLCIITQRPSEVDPTILSQCNTMFVMRLSNELDQQIITAASSDAVTSLLEFLPSLGVGEGIAFGEGMTLPVLLRFDRLPAHAMPKGDANLFSSMWSQDHGNAQFMQAVVDRWRAADLPMINEIHEPATQNISGPITPNSRPLAS